MLVSVQLGTSMMHRRSARYVANRADPSGFRNRVSSASPGNAEREDERAKWRVRERETEEQREITGESICYYGARQN